MMYEKIIDFYFVHEYKSRIRAGLLHFVFVICLSISAIYVLALCNTKLTQQQMSRIVIIMTFLFIKCEREIYMEIINSFS